MYRRRFTLDVYLTQIHHLHYNRQNGMTASMTFGRKSVLCLNGTLRLQNFHHTPHHGTSFLRDLLRFSARLRRRTNVADLMHFKLKQTWAERYLDVHPRASVPQVTIHLYGQRMNFRFLTASGASPDMNAHLREPPFQWMLMQNLRARPPAQLFYRQTPHGLYPALAFRFQLSKVLYSAQ